MSSSTSARPPTELVPRRAVLSLGAVLAGSLGAVALARWAGWRAQTPDASTVSRRLLHFRDRADGGVAIIDAVSGTTLEVVYGEQGFLRGTLRGMARERRRWQATQDGPGAAALDSQPFELLARADGRLTLNDAQTGRRIDLESFGPTNAAVFARWLTLPVPAAAR
ncbi:MAG: photosynthetic complex assembly protein PuhC [Rubrivivax sp.]|nr:photosynthetic complex assembly protein PuhC [Rubrivivax sp.]